MTMIRLSITLLGILLAGWSTTPAYAQTTKDEDEAAKARDRKFDTLLAAAEKDPKKADWKALRHAFAETSYYQPYDTTSKDAFGKVVEKLRGGNLKEAETAIVKLNAREHSMRIDGHAIAGVLYEQMGDSEKAQKHKEFFEGLRSTLIAPDQGTSFEKPIEVLFISEEYDVLMEMRLKVKSQALSVQDGHHFDVLTTHARAGQPERVLYFNIDMPWNSLQAGMTKVFDKSKKAEVKK
jgi:hypothetical protein